MRKSWKTVDVKLVAMGILPQGRSIRACRMFCRRHGIVFPGKKIIDENDELIKLLDERYSPKQTKGTEMKKETPNENLRIINVASIDENDDNPRTRIENVEDLKASIKANGLLQPIVVRSKQPNKHWKVVAGSRRFKACKELGLDAIPCIVIDADDAKAYELATTENIVRENMNAVDEANAVQKLFAQGKSRIEIGAMFGKSARWAEGRRRIAELGGKAMEYLAAGKINLGHAEVLTMCPAEDVEKYLNVATYKTPEDLKNEIMNAKPLLERAPFDAKKVCKHCENRSDMQTDLFGDVQCCYCLYKECFEKQVAKKAEEIRKDYIKQGFEEVPEEDVDKAEYGYGDYLDAETDDEDEQKTIEKLKSEGVKPMFWVNTEKADHGLVYHLTRSDDEDCDDDDEPTDPDSWEFKFNHLDYKTKNKVNEAASEAEKRAIRNDLKNIFAGISKPAQAFLMELFGCYFDAKDEDGSTHEESYLKHIGESDTEDDWGELFITCVADECVSMWSGMNKARREFFNIASRETFEQEAYEEISKDADNSEESDDNDDDLEDEED